MIAAVSSLSLYTSLLSTSPLPSFRAYSHMIHMIHMIHTHDPLLLHKAKIRLKELTLLGELAKVPLVRCQMSGVGGM